MSTPSTEQRDRTGRDSAPSALFLSLQRAWYAIPLRLIVGYGFMEHGYAKLARGPQAFVEILHALGTPAPTVLAWATILVELLGGLAVLAGLLIPLASIPMASSCWSQSSPYTCPTASAPSSCCP